MLPETGLLGTHMVYGDRIFDYHDADFVLFGVTAEEIRWLQSGVVVPHVTGRPLRRRRHLRQWARRERRSRTRHCGARFCRLRARRPVDLHGHLPSLGPCAGRVGDVPRCPRCHLRHLRRVRTARRGRALLISPCAPASTASFSVKVELLFMRRGWLTLFGPVSRVAPSAKSSSKGACAHGPTVVYSSTTGSLGGPSKGFSRRPLFGVSRRR